MSSHQDALQFDRRKFLTGSSMAMAAVATSSLLGTNGFAWEQPAAAETVEVKTAYGQATRCA